MSQRRIVVTGLGLLSPVGNTVAESWDSICNGRSGVGPVTEFDVSELNTRIAEVLKDNLITPEMATSLLNDFNYVDETSNHLLDTAQALLSSHADLVAEAAREVVLDEDEIEKATAA